MKRVGFLGVVLVSLTLLFGSVAGAALTNFGSFTDIKAQQGCGPTGAFGCIQIGDKQFSNFSLTKVLGPAYIGEGDVNVQGEQIGSTVFIYFGAAFTANSVTGMLHDWNLFYDVFSLGGLIDSIGQSYVHSAGGAGGIVSIGETVFDGLVAVAQSSVGCVSGTPPCDLSDPEAEVLVQGDDLIIAPPLPGVRVRKDIFVAANTGGTVGATSIIQSYNQVPEPAHVVFLLSSLLIIGLYYKSRKQSQA